jgi:hypothetical protein
VLPDDLGGEDPKAWREPGMQYTPILARGPAFLLFEARFTQQDLLRQSAVEREEFT